MAAIATETSTIVDVKDISKAFFDQTKKPPQGVLVLDRLNFQMKRREFVSVIGPSGCGKTTLIRVIAGLILADAGEVIVNGQAVHSPGRDRCMVFQNFGLLPWRTVLSNVEFALELQGMAKAARREAALRQISRVGLTGFENHYPHQVSGGMQQRAGLARALSTDPDILLMDEPFSAVDAQTRELLQEELLKLLESTDTTIFFVTHSIDEAVYLSDRVIVMTPRPGRVMENVVVGLPRPRWGFDVKSDPEYVRLAGHIRDLLRPAVARAAQEELSQ